MIVIMAGLPGTGKSTLARALAQRLAGAVLDKDEIRAALFAAGTRRVFAGAGRFLPGDHAERLPRICWLRMPDSTFCWMAERSRGDTSGSA